MCASDRICASFWVGGYSYYIAPTTEHNRLPGSLGRDLTHISSEQTRCASSVEVGIIIIAHTYMYAYTYI